MPKTEQIRIVERKLQEISEKMQQLIKIKTYLTNKLSGLKYEVNADSSSDFQPLSHTQS